MSRYLLYDSGCGACSGIVAKINREIEGFLEARSLRDDEIRAVLDAARPGWRWEPMLLESKGNKTRVYSGNRLKLRLVRILGLRRALRVRRIVADELQASAPVDESRRQLIRQGGMIGGLLMVFGLPALRASRTAQAETELDYGDMDWELTPLSLADAQTALQVALASTQVQSIRTQNVGVGNQLSLAPQTIAYLGTSEGREHYGVSGRAVSNLGRIDSHRMAWVRLEVDTSNTAPEKVAIVNAFVNLNTNQVEEAFQTEATVVGEQTTVEIWRDISQKAIGIAENGEITILGIDICLEGLICALIWMGKCSMDCWLVCQVLDPTNCQTICNAVCVLSRKILCGQANCTPAGCPGIYPESICSKCKNKNDPFKCGQCAVMCATERLIGAPGPWCAACRQYCQHPDCM